MFSDDDGDGGVGECEHELHQAVRRGVLSMSGYAVRSVAGGECASSGNTTESWMHLSHDVYACQPGQR